MYRFGALALFIFRKFVQPQICIHNLGLRFTAYVKSMTKVILSLFFTLFKKKKVKIRKTANISNEIRYK